MRWNANMTDPAKPPAVRDCCTCPQCASWTQVNSEELAELRSRPTREEFEAKRQAAALWHADYINVMQRVAALEAKLAASEAERERLKNGEATMRSDAEIHRTRAAYLEIKLAAGGAQEGK